jgi:hypothetical protein
VTTEIAMRREGSHLVPVDEVSADQICQIPTTKSLLVEVKTPRNVRQFRLAWALAQVVGEAVDFLHDREDSMSWLKIKARHVTMLQNPRTKQVAIIPKSIAFASLSQDAFNRIFNRMVWVVCNEIIPGLQEGALRAELEAMVGIEAPASPPDAPTASEATKIATGPENAPAVTPMPGKRRPAKVGPIKPPTTPPDFVCRRPARTIT